MRSMRPNFLSMALLIVAASWTACGSETNSVFDAGNDATDSGGAKRFSRSFTSSKDFDLGVLEGVNHDSEENQLQMNQGRSVFQTPYIWITNTFDTKVVSTVTQIDTKTGEIVAEIPLEWNGKKCINSSRSTVNADFDVWVACRGSANIAKISHTDKAVINIVDLEGVPRGMAIDADGYLWVGCGDDPSGDLDPVYKLVEKTGECVLGNKPGCQGPPIMVADWPYGAAVDMHGKLWMLSNHHWTGGTLTKIDTKTDSIVGIFQRPSGCSCFYGIAIDQMGNIWTGNHTCNDILKFNNDGVFQGGYMSGGTHTRGVAVDLDGNVWVALSNTSTATKHMGRTGDIIHTLNVGEHPIGVGVDAYGNVWMVNHNSSNVFKVNGLTYERQIIDLNSPNPSKGARHPYTYSDMLGTSFNMITMRKTNTASWAVKYDSGINSPNWKSLGWSEEEPPGSSVRVRSRCAATEPGLDVAVWSPFLDSPGPITCEALRWIEVEAQFSCPDLTTTPILKDLTVIWEE